MMFSEKTINQIVFTGTLFGMIASIAIALSGCEATDNHAVEILEKQGFTNVSLDGYPLVGCSEDDFYNRNFTATSINGQQSKGVICKGMLKGYTVRLY